MNYARDVESNVPCVVIGLVNMWLYLPDNYLLVSLTSCQTLLRDLIKNSIKSSLEMIYKQ